MKKTKIIAIILIISLLSALIYIPASAATVIEWNEPAIPANAREKISLSDYSVRFTEGGAAKADLKWKLDGKEITEYTPSEPGVYTLTAIDGTTEKNIYVVAKNKNDEDYILYSNDFSSDSMSDLTLGSDSSRYTISDGKLIIDGTGSGATRVMLPKWLSDFGNYDITASVMTSNAQDTGRWNSIMYRIQNDNYPFYQMCVRKNAAASNGVEFALCTPSNTWNVITTAAFTESQKDNTYYTYRVQIKDNNLLQSINGKDIIFNTDEKTYKAGRIGLQCNYSKMHIDYITVKLQLKKPEMTAPKTMIETTATVENISNSFTNIAIVNTAADFEKLSNAMSVILTLKDDSIVDANGNELCKLENVFDKIGNNILPIYKIEDNKSADALAAFIKNDTYVDVAVISTKTSVVKYARSKNKQIRGIIDFTDKYTSVLSLKEIHKIREDVIGATAKTAVINMSALTKEGVAEMQELLLSVWGYNNNLTKLTDAAELITSGVHGTVTNNPDLIKNAYSLFDENTLTRTPLIIGHRGNPTKAPENSISGYLKAVENGADVVETDIYLTKDKQIVIMHDGTIDRTTDGTGNVESMTMDELRKYHVWGDNDQYKNAYPNEVIPTLEELFIAIKDKTDAKIFVEIKSGNQEILKILVDLVDKYDMYHRISIISFNGVLLGRLNALMPQVSCGYLLSAFGATASQSLATAQINAMLKLIQNYHTTINPANGNLTKILAYEANNRGLTIWPWTYRINSGNVDTDFCNAFLRGINGLTTDDPQYTVNTIKSIQADSTMNIGLNHSATGDVTSTTYGRVTSAITATPVILEGEEFISVDGNNILGKKAGSAVVMFKYETKLPNNKPYVLYTSPVTVNVLTEDESALITVKPNTYTVEDGIIITDKDNIKVGDFIKNITNSDIKIFKGETELTAEDIIGTDCVIKSYLNGEVKDTKSIAVIGDLNGDGVSNKDDAAAMFSKALTPAGVKAADVNKTKTVTTADYLTIYRR
ncbi:DUF1080 domain-containing protein [Eubacteriales bacterium OttesenSCG-928-G02]|nr:DUF1080 domain-containing protein [Eubacteriales bacterium OttesenSCG-928-G02]